MSRDPSWRRYLRLLRPNPDADVDDELQFHLEMRERDYTARGVPPAEARQLARERFGDIARVRRWLRRHDERRQRVAQRREKTAMLIDQFRYAGRSLRQQPTFTIAALVTLALGIGATTTVFSVVNAVLLEPLPYPRSDRLIASWHLGEGMPGVELPSSHATYVVYRRFNRTLADLGAYDETAVNINDGTRPERVPGANVTSGVFSTLQVRPLIGRTFRSTDEQPGHPAVVLISEHLWRERLGSAPDILERQLRIDDVPHDVIGVIPSSVRFPHDETQLWLPLTFDEADPAPAGFRYNIVARLRDGVTLDAATRDLQRALPRLPELFPNAAPGFPMQRWLELARPRVVLHSLRDDVVGDVGRVLWVIFGTIAFVLVAACANIANLCLVRAEGRRQELAVLAALGAGRLDAIARFFAEGLILAGLGAVLGVALAWASLHALREATAIPIPRLAGVGIDGTVLAATALVSLAVGLLTSAVPIVRIGSRDLATALRAGGRGATAGRDRRRMQHGLVVTQVALAFVLLIASSLMARTFVELRRVRLGFDIDHALTFRLFLPPARYTDIASVIDFEERLSARLASLPAAEATGLATWLPLQEEGRMLQPTFVEGMEASRKDAADAHPVIQASASYFRSLGVPVLTGRVFRDVPLGERSTEAIVTASFARWAWGDSTGSSAMGQRIRLLPQSPWLTVVGVVGDSRQTRLDRPPVPMVYVPLASDAYGRPLAFQPRNVAFVVRTTGSSQALAAAVRREVAALDASLPIYQLQPLREIVRRSMARTTFTALLLGVAAAVAVGLGAIGLYGVVAYSVATRRREIGLRIALGARPNAVSRALATQGTALAAMGIGIGLAGALAVTRVLGALLYGVSPSDPRMLGGAAFLLLTVAAAASWLPARRAAGVDPATVLNAD
jgi:predicted permease